MFIKILSQQKKSLTQVTLYLNTKKFDFKFPRLLYVYCKFFYPLKNIFQLFHQKHPSKLQLKNKKNR